MSKSSIAWCEHTWNPIVGCSIPTLPSTGKPRAGCLHCYASKDAPHRFPKVYARDGVIVIRGKAKREGLTFVPRTTKGKSLGKGAQWTGEIRCLPWQLEVPLKRKKPTTYFVNSLSDMFHESLVDCEEGRRFIAAIFGVMAACPQHRFQILTKRPHKAREWFEWAEADGIAEIRAQSNADAALGRTVDLPAAKVWPLTNAWIGASVEDQASVGWAIPELLRVPAAVRFLSAEPLLGPLDLDPLVCPDCGLHDLDLVICGGESGPKARDCEVRWLRSIVEQCKSAQVPCFVKQLGARPVARDEDDLGPDALASWDYEHAFGPFPLEGYIPRLRSKAGSDPTEWPADLRVRELPT